MIPKSSLEGELGLSYPKFVVSAVFRLGVGYLFLFNVLLVIVQSERVLDMFYDMVSSRKHFIARFCVRGLPELTCPISVLQAGSELCGHDRRYRVQARSARYLGQAPEERHHYDMLPERIRAKAVLISEEDGELFGCASLCVHHDWTL